MGGATTRRRGEKYLKKNESSKWEIVSEEQGHGVATWGSSNRGAAMWGSSNVKQQVGSYVREQLAGSNDLEQLAGSNDLEQQARNSDLEQQAGTSHVGE
jgi:hypothetical protein